ncbi:tail protein [Pseudomonas phage Lana]|uniref:Tail assembly protein I n=1 Tax=Pseudomonas phage Lana TaxID=2530172 RepID=A0A481W643_9CAUD|nr:tail protein [Pseudomonas phage Lana]QBJ04556.1 tail assembly protein I [Pseudomonas phage Lana]
MKTFYLHGWAAERYGASFELDVGSPAEAIKALASQLPGFQKMIEEHDWHVVRGPLDQQQSDDVESVRLRLGSETEIHLLPAMAGAGGGGGFMGGLMTVVGVALMIAATFFSGGTAGALFGAGLGMTVGGVISLTTKMPGADPVTESADNRASFLFAGPKNSSTQGVAIPRGYGRQRVGSIVISVGLYAEETAT